jgi:hypothetical protein
MSETAPKKELTFALHTMIHSSYVNMNLYDQTIMTSNSMEANLLFAILEEAKKQTQLLKDLIYMDGTKPAVDSSAVIELLTEIKSNTTKSYDGGPG